MSLLEAPTAFSPEYAQVAFGRAFTDNGPATQLGLMPLAGKKVLDIGAGDGRYTQVLAKLDPAELTALDIHQCFLDKGQQQGWLPDQIICADAVDFAKDPLNQERFDCVTLMNLAPGDHLRQINPLLLAAHSLLKPSGQLLVTLVERYRLSTVQTDMSLLFGAVKYSKVWRGFRLLPAHNVMLVGTDKLPLASNR